MIPDSGMFRKTKIVCTIGPACGSIEMLKKLAIAGMNVARLNFSHGTREEHAARIELIRQVSSQLDLPLAILQDLPGAKVRIGKLREEFVTLEKGNDFILTSKTILGDAYIASVSLPSLPRYVNQGDTIFLSDGTIKLEVVGITNTEIKCRVVTGGVLTSKRGINVPGAGFGVSSTDNDLGDLLFGIEHGVDFVALSFVKEKSDVLRIKQFLQARGANIPLIAKIESHEAVEHFDEILAEADGIMVARGDLGVEIPVSRVPLVQKEIISKCNQSGKPVIVATQMLISMVYSPFPTRAEVSDIANAILDGTDAVMLSEETAIGKYPEEAVVTMAQIAIETEKALPFQRILSENKEKFTSQTDDAISYAACQVAHQLGAVGIIAYTTSGSTAQRVSKYRPKVPILAITPSDDVRRKLCLFWGVYSYRVIGYTKVEEIFEQGARLAVKSGLAKSGDLLVVTAGVPFGMAGTTNMLKVQKVD